MQHATGERPELSLRGALGRRLAPERHGSGAASDAGRLAFREPDAALGRSAAGADVNDADRPAHVLAMHCGRCP
jgi:hypothetical protein